MPKKNIENIDMFKYENEAYAEGYSIICGIDEAGRGPLAGPVVAAAVILDPDNEIEGLNDSKKLSEKKRALLYDEIIEKARAYGVFFVYEDEIDEINILNATYKAMLGAFHKLRIVPDIALIDGNSIKGFDVNTRCIVKGDANSSSIAAASILAKVTRDRYMIEISAKYPEYDFARHKGYGTKLHYEKLDEFGVCPIHRKTFLKKYFNKK